MNKNLEKLNLIAQNRIPLADALHWFEAYERDEKLGILTSLNMCVKQAHPNLDDLASAIDLVGIKETYTPCVMIRKGVVGLSSIKGLGGLDKLKDFDLSRAFLLLIGLLSVADGRRRNTLCQGRCDHWWHHI